MADLLTLKQVAKQLDVSERTVLRLLDSKELVGFKVKRVWRFEQSDIDAYIQRQKEKSKNAA